MQLLACQVAGVGLGQQPGLQRRDSALQGLDSRQAFDQVDVVEPGHEPVVQCHQLGASGLQHHSGGDTHGHDELRTLDLCPGTHRRDCDDLDASAPTSRREPKEH